MNEDAHWTKEEHELFEAFLQLKNTDEMARFCRDLMTLQEIKEFAKRWKTVKILESGTMSYQQIAKEVGTSTATITRTNHWLKHGMDGYALVLQRLKKK